MSSKEIVVSGVAYVRSRDAARVVHLAPDHISRFARGRLIEGQLDRRDYARQLDRRQQQRGRADLFAVLHRS
jgi:hypothetical protein